MAGKVTDPALLRLLESSDTPPAASGGRKVMDPALLAQLEAPEQPVAMTMEYDAMGNPTGSMVAAPQQPTMGYGEQMSNVGRVVDNSVRVLANGATFGIADRIAGGMDAVTGQAPGYGAGVDAQHARTQGIKDANPILAGVGEAAGGLLTGAGLIKNGVTLAGRVGPGLLPRVLGYGAEGAAYGAAQGAGNTYTGQASDYLSGAFEGGKFGLGIGAGMPVIGSLAGGAYRIAAAMAAPKVEGVNRAGSAALRAAAQADEAGLRALPTMGPEAMLPDAGPSMLGLAQGAATGNGAGKTALVNALRERDAGTGQRLGNVVDDAIGPAPIPSQVEAGLATNRKALGPEYESALDGARSVAPTPPSNTPYWGFASETPRAPGPAAQASTATVADAIDTRIVDARGPVRTALEKAREMLNVYGTRQLDPSPRALLETRHALDGMIGEAERGGNSTVVRALSDVRKQVDGVLKDAVPGIKATDAKYAELARQSEGLERGQTIFDTSRASVIRPAELADEISAGAIPRGEAVGPSAVPVRIRQGARAEIDRVVGTQVNDLNAMERTLGTPQDWNQQKAAIVFGQDKIDRIVEALRTNRTFRDTFQKVAQGSQTAPRAEAARALDAADGPKGDTTLTGLGVTAVRSVAKALMGANSQATKDQVATLMASPNMARIAAALLETAGRTRETARSISQAVTNPAYLAGASPAAGRK
ncbi:hypothetical protein [Bosea sp. PAMC 26642]|uniref:hypothetical protein n=1 Tax=Bosea sp. (strain PAMC 26642) TaxID=1792307 RepID=UPI000770390D|nr:hypothetical protein [Bosea sp. PAMC 26642]AMJ61984.1 hypothetical protein AXW83_18260 [Bosea sp. PAMC 26642]